MNNPKFFDIRNLSGAAGPAVFDWRNYWYILKRRKWFVMIPGIIGGLIGLYVALSITKKYESSTSILVEGSKLMTSEVRKVVPGVTENDEISAITRYVTSTECIVDLITTLGLHRDPELHKAATKLHRQFPDRTLKEIEDLLFIEDIRKKISVKSKGRDLVLLSAVHEDPNTAYLLAKTLAQIFIQESQKRQLGSIRGVREFSEEQLAIYKDKLEQAEQRLKQYQKEILQKQMQNTTIDDNTLKRLKSEITSIEINIQSKANRMSQLRSTFPAGQSEQFRKSQQTIKLERQALGTSEDLAKNLATFEWNTPQILRLSDELNNLRGLIRNNYRQDLQLAAKDAPQYQFEPVIVLNMLSLDLKLLQKQKQTLERIVERSKARVSEGPTHTMILTTLKQDVEQNRRVYLNFLGQLRGTQIEEEVQRKDAEFRLQIVEPAKKPLYPQGLGRTVILLLSIIVGSGIGVAIVIGLEYIDQSIKDVAEIENTFRLPVWGVIPNLEDLQVSTWQREGMIYILVLFGTAIAATLIVIIKKGNLL